MLDKNHFERITFLTAVSGVREDSYRTPHWDSLILSCAVKPGFQRRADQAENPGSAKTFLVWQPNTWPDTA